MATGPHSRPLLASFALAVVLGLQLPQSSAAQRFVERPRIEGGAVVARVLYVENPRFPKVGIEDVRAVLRSAAALVREHLGVAIRYSDEHRVVDIDDVFAEVIRKRRRSFGASIGDFRNRRVDWGRIEALLVEQIEKEHDTLPGQIEFARPYLLSPLREETLDAFASAVVATFRHRLMHWTTARLDDGHPVIGAVPGRPDLPHNEYVYWALMLKLGIEAEIVLTNQLVASVEYMPLPVHTSIRGGITGGSTEYNPWSRLGTSVWVSLFPFLSEDRQIVRLRDGELYSREAALAHAGAMLAHEMGHQLLQLGHPWSNRACLMRPARALAFAAWVDGLDARSCPIGSSPAMTPGTMKAPIW